ncbi:hypothetical protein T439DRAFT_327909 [Meredithblackwellia eburnea MCA 4105]
MTTPTLPTTRGSSSSDPRNGLPLEALTMDQIGAANRAAQMDGLGVGGLAGFLGGFLSHRLFRQSRNVALLSGLLTGSLAGYIFTQTALKVHLAKASASSTVLRDALSSSSSSELEGRRQWTNHDDNEREGGVGGLEGLHDKYATTRGDH